MTQLSPFDLAVWRHAIARLVPKPRRWASPGDMAVELDHTTVQTPALRLIDRELVALADGHDDRLLISMPPQEGKALALDTPIATPTGWANLGELAVGDQIFDRYGEPCSVTWVSPIWRDRPCYEVVTGDGDRIVADAAHEWPAVIWAAGSERVVETAELAVIRSKNAQITGSADLNLSDADLPLDPYVLGVWLGDGHSHGARITSADPEIIARIEGAGWPCRKDTSKYGWSLTPAVRTSAASPFRRVLQELGVWGNKHVPIRYLRGSSKQRLALLQGLVDTDGYVSPRGQVEFCSTRRTLAESVQHLVFSLGAKATLVEGRASVNGKDCGLKYRVRFYLADAAWLPRKAVRCRDAKTARTRYVWAREVPSVPVRCIEVDSPSHTFLAGRSLLPTHNSERASRRFPLWLLVDNPDLRIAIVSYSDEMARRWGAEIKRDLEDNPDLGLELRADSKAAGRWQIEGRRGGVYCVGIAGSLTGKPVDVCLIDDPIKDLEQARSQAYSERAWRFWQGVLIPRLGPGAKAVVIQTRWAEDDLAGRLLQHEGDKAKGGRWRVINIPAQAEDDGNDPLGRRPGEYMISARGDRDWASTRRSVGEYVWAALYGGRPAPAEGGLFKRLWWRHWAPAPPQAYGDRIDLAGRIFDLRDCWRFVTGDLAASTRTSADWTVAAAWALTIDGDLVLLDYQRGKIGERDHFDLFRPLAQRWQVDTVFLEASQYGTTLVAEATRSGLHITPIQAEVDKFSRALPYSARCSGGRVWLPAGQKADDWVTEHASFPNGSHDDMVDVGSLATRVAVTKWQPPPPTRHIPEPDPYAHLGGAMAADYLNCPL